jgi:UDP-N-acetylmuramoyl-L-alanyl-D-glutamate--2,6-diaminopimelate ligase
LEKVYEVFQNSRKICVLGSCGGGRDKWKRPEMGKIASQHCDQIILTNEDPYDEDPNQILSDIKSGISNDEFLISNVYEILDRREAIKKALSCAKTGDAVIVTGKGAEPWIMGPKGAKIKWDDREIARKELKKLLNL